MTAPLAACPKHMIYGPCAGVAPDGTCEVAPEPCVFLDQGVIAWAGPERDPGGGDDPLLARLRAGTHPVVVCSAPDGPPEAAHLRRIARRFRGVADALLFGDANWARVQLPPSFRARLVADEGVRPWAGVNCRDRNRVALEGELAALAEVGAAVHCVTGDHPASGHRPDAAPVFDLDSTQLAALARGVGVPVVSVAGSPVAEPVAIRPARLAEKARAGAQVCFVNHCRDIDRIATYIAAARAAGAADVAFVVCVPVLAAPSAAALMAQFANFDPPAERAGEDPVAVAIHHARAALAIPGVGGIELGGPASPDELTLALDAVAEVAGALRAEVAAP